MIGKIYSSVVPFYDRVKQAKAFKRRPVLIIGGPRNNDYTVLPVSTVSNRQNLDADYDIEIYLNILGKLEEFNQNILEHAL